MTVPQGPHQPPPGAGPVPPPGYGPLDGFPAVPIGYPPAAPPPKRRTGIIVAAIAGGAVILLCLGLGALAVFSPGRGPIAAGPNGPAPANPAGAYDGKDLRTMMLPRSALPSGFFPALHPLSQDGNFSLNQMAARFEVSENARAALTADGFTAGAIAQWQKADGSDLEIRLLQFQDASGAGAWEKTVFLGSASTPGAADKSPAAGIPGSYFLVGLPFPPNGTIESLLLMTKNNVVAEVRYGVVGAAPADADVLAVAQRQYGLMP